MITCDQLHLRTTLKQIN